jgi:hypothetical protein
LKVSPKKRISPTTTDDGFEQLFLPLSSRQDDVDNSLVRPEQHMFLRPYFVLDKRADKSVGIETSEIVTINNKKIERRWCVTPDREYGMPGPFERDVLIALYVIAYELYLSKRLPVPEMMHIGSLRSFIARLGLSYSGQNAAAVKLALKRLVHTA